MKNKMLVIALVSLSLMSGGMAFAGKKQVIKAMGGALIPSLNIVIDASYDAKLDNLVPGFKILNVAIINNSFNIIELDPQKDQWWVRVKRDSNKKYRLVGDLRGENAAVWNKLPDRARTLIGYPLLLPIGARQVVDLFVPENVPIENFSELIVYIDSLKTTIEILARQ